MAIRPVTELLGAIVQRLGETGEDADLSIIEDVTDTMHDLEDRASDAWRDRYDDLRTRYIERFQAGPDDPPGNPDPDPDPDEETVVLKTKFEELFEEVN